MELAANFYNHVSLNAQAKMLFFTLAGASYERAFLISALFDATSSSCAGVIVSFRYLPKRMAWIRYVSLHKYCTTALFMHLFEGRPISTVLGPVPRMLKMLELDSPATVGANMLVCVSFSVLFTVGGYVCLRCTKVRR